MTSLFDSRSVVGMHKTVIDSLKRGQDRPMLRDISVFYDRSKADSVAEGWRINGLSARIYPRCVRADGATLELFVVVVRDRAV